MVQLRADELMLEGLKKVHRGKMFLTYNIIVTYIYTDDFFLYTLQSSSSLYTNSLISMCHLSTRWIPSIMYGYHFLASCIHHQLPCRDPSQGVKYTCEITGSPATLVCSECPVYFATYDAQHETILVGDFWKTNPKSLEWNFVGFRRFLKHEVFVRSTVTFRSESQNQDLEAIGRLVARPFSMKSPLQHLIILLFSVGTCFEIYFIDMWF